MLDYYISFSPQQRIFYAGQSVTATVFLETDKPIKARKIDLRVIGRARTSWEEWRNYGGYYDCHGHYQSNSYTVYYGNQINYLNLYTILWRSKDGSNRLAPGKYQFPFTFTIPSNAAPNVSGEYGSIDYYVRTNIDIPWAKDREEIRGFTVHPLIDLKLDPRLLRAMEGNDTVTQCKCCRDPPLNFTVGIPKHGWAIGEYIPVSIKIDNRTSWKIKRYEVGFDQKLSYLGQFQGDSCWGGYYYRMPEPPESERHSSETIAYDVIEVDKKTPEATIINCKVPVCAPSSQKGSIIAVKYVLFIKAVTNAIFRSGPEVRIPITIGSVPITEVSQKVSSNKTTTKEKSAKESKESKEVVKSNQTTAKSNEKSEVSVSPKANA